MASRGLAAFSRTPIRMGPIANVDENLVKWWGKHKPIDGMVIRHLSPYEQQIIRPWLTTFPKKVKDRAFNYIVYLGGTIALYFGSVEYANSSDAAEQFEHRF